MQNSPAFQIRTMTESELGFAVDLAAAEGWNPGLHDARCFYRADPRGFLIAVLDGHPIGCISAVSYADRFGFVGLYIVVPQHRGKGFGIALWREATARLQGHNIGLDGVVAQQENYRKSGFHLAYRNIRYSGRAWPNPPDCPAIVPLSGLSPAMIANYDARFFPAPRQDFLASWISQPDSLALGFIRGGQLAGYGVIRTCRSGRKVGPLFADDPKIAHDLLLHLAAGAGTELFLDVPEANPAAVALAEEFGMQKVFETARMYTGEPPTVDLQGTFGITTFELG